VIGQNHGMSSPTEDDAAATLVAGRARIDALDAQIIELVRQRVETSDELQRIRMATGEPRIAHTRELQIVDRYSAALGKPGAQLALTVLELCRGRT
jgi:chorismate mutase